MGVFFYPQTGNQLSQERHNIFSKFFFQTYVKKAAAFKNQSFDVLSLKCDLEIQGHALFESSFHITVPISSPG